MSKKLNLNSDLGESFGAVSVREARDALVAREKRWSDWVAGVKFGLPAPCSMSDDMGYGWLGGEDY